MARKKRDWWPGATYHIMCRGNHRNNIFRDDEDREVYRSVLRQVRLTHPFILHAYCLMTNHVHLQLETQNMAPGQVLKMINMKYAIFFNKKYRFVGHLLQGRFRAEIIDSDEYFLAINRYIHLNPVKADMVKDPYDYPWSSYREYFEELPNPLVETEKMLSYFKEPRCERFAEFTRQGICAHSESVQETLPARLLLDDADDQLEDGEDSPDTEFEEVK